MKRNERWKSIKEYKDLYLVSNFGRIKSLISNKILRPYLNKGYLTVSLYKNKKRKNKRIHRLVINSFLYHSSREVNHIDGNKQNNNISNLEYSNRKHNMNHAFENNLIKKCFGEKNIHSKLKNFEVKEIKNMIKLGYKNKDIAVLFNVDASLISHIKRGYVWSHVNA